MNLFKKNFLRTLSVVVYFSLINIIQAASDQVINSIPKAPITNIDQTYGAVAAIVTWFINLFWILAVATVIYAAFLYLTAGGNEEKVTKAKKFLLYAVIAAAIALLSTGIDIIVSGLLTGRIQ
ncbi:MAG: hypothetical protein AAB432_00985 [Patescibacteria group bacterium]